MSIPMQPDASLPVAQRAGEGNAAVTAAPPPFPKDWMQLLEKGEADNASPLDAIIYAVAHACVETAAAKGYHLAVAESCTAGMVSSALACVPGASRVLWGSFVCYSIEAKQAMLGVPAGLITRYGAVSGECADSMSRGALERSGADLAAAITGLAGPDGDGSSNPVGTVWIAWAVRKGGFSAQRFLFPFRSRAAIRTAACLTALEGITQRCAIT